MRKMAVFTKTTLYLGVVLLGIALCADQSDIETSEVQEMASMDSNEGKSRIEAPQVVLQLKYDDGELDRIYLAQFRKETKSSILSVKARTSLCADLCHAGLGGTVCGTSCLDLLPVGLKSALKNSSDEETLQYGEPRTDVCPTLCEYHLGQPLCGCSSDEVKVVDWNAICAAFCSVDQYVLSGCPSCQDGASTLIPVSSFMSRALSTAEGWSAWCNVQCRQGHGGAACNCDKTPFQ